MCSLCLPIYIQLSIETNSLRTVTWQYIVETSEDEGINSSVLLDQITAEICDCPEGHVGEIMNTL